jgi:hypothetical protein
MSVINVSNYSGSIGGLKVNNAIVTPYVLGTSCLTGTVEFYGDSIMIGLNLPSPTTQRFSALLAAQYGFTELNTGVSGDVAQDMVGKIYNNHVGGRTAVVKIGYNDCYYASYTDANMYVVYDTIMAELLYLCLSSTQLVSNRTPYATQTGTWINTGSFTHGGGYSNVNGATTTATVTGRYVGVIFANSSTCSISIDGATALPVTTYTPPSTTNGANYSALVYLYDTGTTGGSHTILVTNTSTSYTDVEWFFGFDNLSGTTNSSVIVMGLEPATFQGTTTGTLNRQTLINNFQWGIVKMLRQAYGAKISFVYSIPYFSWANKLSDNIHPDVHGHIRLQNLVTNTLTGGETIQYV